MDNPILTGTLALLCSYMLGSIPTAFMLGKMKGIDLRDHGSGNIGATNAFRVLGKELGAFCLVADITKGIVPVLLLAGAWSQPDIVLPTTWKMIVGIAAIVGHTLSPWLKFKGGKGVATSLGVFAAVAPIPLLICLVVGLTLIGVTKMVSVASIVGSILLPVCIFLLPPGGKVSVPLIAIPTLVAVFVIFKHRENVARIRAGNEKKLFQKSAGGKDENA